MTVAGGAASLARQLAGYGTLLDGLRAAPRGAPFVTMWYPDRTPPHETLTFGEFLDQAWGFAAWYREQSVKPGDRIVLIMPQSPRLMAAFAGAMLVPAVPTILAFPTFKIDPAKYRHGLSGVTRNIGARLVVLDRTFPAELLQHITGHVESTLARDDGVAARPGGDGDWPGPRPEDVAFIQHSAGTTGLQKGVALSHGAVLSHLVELATALRLEPADRIVSWLPLYHDMGLIACLVLPLMAHVPLVMESPTDWVLRPGSMLALASTFRCTLGWVPNFALQFMARRVPPAERQGLDLSSVRALINCSEPVRHQSVEEFLAAYRERGLAPSALQASYAMAEATFAVTQSPIDGRSRPPTIWVDREVFRQEHRLVRREPSDPAALPLTSSGRCLPGAAVRIAGDDGGDLPDGQVGEIWIRTPSLFQGYWNRPDLTARALVDGWFRTGDSGVRLDGELYVLGRRDDTIIVGGENLYPHDIEEIVAAHPAVHDGRAVAFGVDNADLGTQALVVLAEAASEDVLARRAEVEAELRRAVLGQLGIAPRLVRLVPPRWVVKSTAGKVARAANRDKFLREGAP
jgi:acyl-CoA synthetase (AMP-forming)/AMP-acid ligase II